MSALNYEFSNTLCDTVSFEPFCVKICWGSDL